ncbi:MAG: transposase [Gemmatimonadota bacterium]|nr:transposase [Gemmatimonadota bacterium]
MKAREMRQCQCNMCRRGGKAQVTMIHQQINLVMSRLNEQQRRWYAAVEANRHGHGGIKLVSEITGLDEKTIARGQEELAFDLESRPQDRIRLPGGGRPNTQKKTQP